MEVEGSWKGRIWFLYFIWFFVIIAAIINIREIKIETKEEWTYFIIFLAITGLWIYGTKVLIKNIKDTFKTK